MPDPPDPNAFARRQHRQVTRAQLLGAGIDDDAIRPRVKSGALFREYPGVYSVGWRASTPLERVSAAVLACGLHAALSGFSALTHWGVRRRWEEPFEVTVWKGDPKPKGVRVHRSSTLKPYDTVKHNGVRVTKLARAILDVAPRLTDEELHRTVDDALHTPYLKRGQLFEQLRRNPRHPGTKRLLAYLSTGDGPTRADWEREFPAYCERYDLPRPRMIQRSGGHEVDALFEDEGLIVELDSWEYHSSRDAFETDRDRDADNLEIGRPTLRITWDRMHKTPDREAARLHRILERLRRRRRAV